MTTKICKVYKCKRDGVTIYRVEYKSGSMRFEVERFLPNTVKEFLTEKIAKREYKEFFNPVFNRMETVYW